MFSLLKPCTALCLKSDVRRCIRLVYIGGRSEGRSGCCGCVGYTEAVVVVVRGRIVVMVSSVIISGDVTATKVMWGSIAVGWLVVRDGCKDDVVRVWYSYCKGTRVEVLWTVV